MALRVEASRFAVLKVEDDDDSDKNDDKPKNMPNKGNQRQTEAKKKPKKKKRTEEIRADSEVFFPYYRSTHGYAPNSAPGPRATEKLGISKCNSSICIALLY